jgi:hypothetical protein
MYIFENSTKRWIFYAPFGLFKEKKFSALRELKRSKMEETAQNFEKRFFINRSQIFIALPKFCVTHQNY